jgi:hypothetical protein
MMFLSIATALINYEEYLGKIQEFQNFEFGGESNSFPIVKIIMQHLLWVIRARGVIDGKMKMDKAVLSDHHSCALGKWIDNTAENKLKENPDFRNMEQRHEALHKRVNELISSTSMSSEEREISYAELLKTSEQVINGLMAVYSTAK